MFSMNGSSQHLVSSHKKVHWLYCLQFGIAETVGYLLRMKLFMYTTNVVHAVMATWPLGAPTYRPHNIIEYNYSKILGTEHVNVKCYVFTLIINFLTKFVTHGIGLMIWESSLASCNISQWFTWLNGTTANKRFCFSLQKVQENLTFNTKFWVRNGIRLTTIKCRTCNIVSRKT